MPPVTYGDLLCVERIGGIDYYQIIRSANRLPFGARELKRIG